MEAITNIRKVLSDKRISVPTYQRAYSWDTPSSTSIKRSQVKEFMEDLMDYYNSKSKSKYYLGHFLFEERTDEYFVIDGQQRLTTITILVAAIFAKLTSIRVLTEDENELYEDIIRRNSKIRFATVYYDNRIFVDYVITGSTVDDRTVETESAKRIIHAYNYFTQEIKNKDEVCLARLLDIISEASCTTHIVENEAEAIQMFIFQNNRGKRPSVLEIIKAQFMYIIHLHGGDDTNVLINKIKDRFEAIYKSISSIENNIGEDDVLNYALKVYFNSLWEDNALERINKCLEETDQLDFIDKFSDELTKCFEYLKVLFRQEKNDINIHSLLILRNISIAYPFLIKAYKLNLTDEKIGSLCNHLESLILRHRLIGTKADIRSRVNDVYQEFDSTDIQKIIDRINWMKTQENYWWGHWNNKALSQSIQGYIYSDIAKYILWKYENYLYKKGKSGYLPRRYDSIDSPELEHIAPKTNPEIPNSGYGRYTESFQNESIECLGNYLLISKSHNCSVGNIKFENKLNSYVHLLQQSEINSFLDKTKRWDKHAIEKRKEVIMNFIISNF